MSDMNADVAYPGSPTSSSSEVPTPATSSQSETSAALASGTSTIASAQDSGQVTDDLRDRSISSGSLIEGSLYLIDSKHVLFRVGSDIICGDTMGDNQDDTVYGSTGIQCQVGSPLYPVRKIPCENGDSGQRIAVYTVGFPQLVCYGDPFYSLQQTILELPAGRVLSYNGVSCMATVTGVKCESYLGPGFFLSNYEMTIYGTSGSDEPGPTASRTTMAAAPDVDVDRDPQIDEPASSANLADSQAYPDGKFQSPSGNIGCFIGNIGDSTSDIAGAYCVILDKEYGSPDPELVDDCPDTWTYRDDSLHLSSKSSSSEEGLAQVACHSKPPTFDERPALPYGEAIAYGDVTCVSTQSGVRCELDDGSHGFILSRREFTIWN
ncbi:hypothetical protein [Nakamurella alba]|uniref:hypothetical protein n=1 Tax=Nakamurella alba TaxID=2665158 RepID=UPI0018A9F80A|nr:hypothetical protein [Nakamurella alba]